jgi:hypothetical protein
MVCGENVAKKTRFLGIALQRSKDARQIGLNMGGISAFAEFTER